MINNIISVSGGKDSTALIALAIALETKNLSFVFADTGNEHEITYEYLDYLESYLNIKIDRVKADFSREIIRKREKLINGKLKGWSDNMVLSAIDFLVPTGNPFIDLCLLKGRFPSSKAKFCSIELKRNPIIEQCFLPKIDSGEIVYSWQGIRRDESLARKYLPEFEELGGGLFNYRPIARWSVESVFEAMREFGIDPNPLYKMGMTRVGCMPCVNCRKSEIRSIADRFPGEIERIKQWERLVSMASKRGSTTFFCATDDPMVNKTDDINYKTHGIESRVAWSRTSRGGRNIDLIAISEDNESCSSAYGLCE